MTRKEELLGLSASNSDAPNVILKAVDSRDHLTKLEGAFSILADVECHLFSCAGLIRGLSLGFFEDQGFALGAA